MTKYELVNPHIEGKFVTHYDAASPIQAAHEFWNSFSKYTTNNMPFFAFTLKEGPKNKEKFLSFMVKEKIGKSDGLVEYTITRLNNMNKTDLKHLESISQLGGAYHKKNGDIVEDSSSSSSGSDSESSASSTDLSSSSSDSDSDTDDIYRTIRNQKMALLPQPIRLFVYNPTIYKLVDNVIAPIKFLNIPTFLHPLSPYMFIKWT